MTERSPLPDLATLRAAFPIFAKPVYGKRLVYLDSAASAQKPKVVLDRLVSFYENDYANIHRGAHALSQRATTLYDQARATTRAFINAAYADEIVFTKGATEAINLVAQSWGRAQLRDGDEVVITGLEHHANIVPWQLLRDERGIVLRVVPLTPEGDVRVEDVAAALGPRTKLVAIAQVSNALGTCLPVASITALAHAREVPVLVDGAQGVCHGATDVQALGADFYAFSGHKLYGPTGIGVLYARRDLLRAMPPWQGGGDMITSVSFEKTLYAEPPQRFEAGTPPIAEAIGLAAAMDQLSAWGIDAIAAREDALRTTLEAELRRQPDVRVIGQAAHKTGLVSFVMEGVHPHDIGTILDREGVAVRTGHHCAEPVMAAFGIPATVRASFGLYNGDDDVDALLRGLAKVREIFR
jgi:cysteine desulfurase/selenocysteine lyase